MSFTNSLSRKQFLSALAATSVTGLFHRHPEASEIQHQALHESGLKDVYQQRFLIGTALSDAFLRRPNLKSTKIISQEFNCITAENTFKWEKLQPELGIWDWELADQFTAFGQKHAMKMVGHVLVWHSQTPENVFYSPSPRKAQPSSAANESTQVHKTLHSRKKQNTLLESHISTVLERYKSTIHYWDVVNEAIEDDGKWRKSLWHDIYDGIDYIKNAFTIAHNVAPHAHLIYNDYNMHLPKKREKTVSLIRTLKSAGVPIHGVGLQGHLLLDKPNLDAFEKSIIAFSQEGVKVHVSELDIDVLPFPNIPAGANISDLADYAETLDPYTDGLPQAISDKLTQTYIDLFQRLIKHAHTIERVTFWGLGDEGSWKNNFPIKGRTNYPLLFDRNLAPKNAYHAIRQL